MSNKMDRMGARTPSDLEYKYAFGKKFAEVMGIATDARDIAEEAYKSFVGLNQEQIFKLLTNNGAWQGVYYDGDDMYINATYIKSGELLADLITAGVLESKDGGQTFKLNLDNGEMEIAGWNVNKDYIGKESAGLNGKMSVTGISEKNVGMPSTMRFYAGASDETTKEAVTFEGIVADDGKFQASVTLPRMMAGTEIGTEIAPVMEIYYTTETGTTFLRESDFSEPLTIAKTGAFSMTASGRLANSAAFGNMLSVMVVYNACDPAWQVLDDGTMVSKYARIGGFPITKETFVDMIYPVGSVYLSMAAVNPSTLFGGTWVQISQGRYLIGVGANRANTTTQHGSMSASTLNIKQAGIMGGAPHTQLTAKNLPPHNHKIYIGQSTASDTHEISNLVNSSFTNKCSWNSTNTEQTGKYKDASGSFVNWGDSVEAVNNMSPYFAVYMWQRTA